MPTLQFLYFDRDEIISSSRYVVKPKPTSVDAKISLTEFNGWFLEKLNYHLGTEELDGQTDTLASHILKLFTGFIIGA